MDRQPLAEHVIEADVEGADAPVRVAVIEDQPVAIDGVRFWLEKDPLHRATVIASGPEIDGVLAVAAAQADVLLLDLDLNGVRVTDRIAGLAADGHRIVVFSAVTDGDTIHAVHESGARSFLGKHESRDHLIEALVAAAGDRPYVTPSVAGAIFTDRRARPHLSDQERTALLLWFQSMSKESVARRMGLSERTVREYIQRARLKYSAQGRAVQTQFALLARAIEDGLIRPEDIQEYRSAAAGSPVPGERVSAEETS
jgi:two-component system nitrate/nitrite response regulator NarL